MITTQRAPALIGELHLGLELAVGRTQLNHTLRAAQAASETERNGSRQHPLIGARKNSGLAGLASTVPAASAAISMRSMPKAKPMHGTSGPPSSATKPS